MSKPSVAIVGCGLIGAKRAAALCGAQLKLCIDINKQRAEALASKYSGASVSTDYKDLAKHPEIDLVIVATTNNLLSEISSFALENGKHVLAEKPAGISVKDVERLISLSKTHKKLVRVGFNHRYHPGFLKARELVDSNALGDLMFLRARYGHGGRVGYDKEWRADPKLSGGGELIDQGVHLIDLARYFLGDFTQIDGHAHTYFWDMPVDDNAFLTLQTKAKQTAFLHVSCSEWKNLFSFELYGRTGKLHIEGLGGSYGVEKITYYRMLPEMGPPETTCWEFPGADKSWEIEFSEFLEDIRLDREPKASANDAKESLTIVESIYKRSGYDHCA